MTRLRSLEGANQSSAVCLTTKRQRVSVGDVFRLSPHPGFFLWGRLVKRANFFGVSFPMNLVYIYDVVSVSQPVKSQLSPDNLIIGPTVVNNLGWSRGYWEIMSSLPTEPGDFRNNHFFKRFRGRGPDDFQVIDEEGRKVNIKDTNVSKLAQAGFSNYNYIDWQVRVILEARGVIPKID